MSGGTIDLGTLPVPPRRTAGSVLRALPAAPVASLVTGVLCVALVTVPDLHVDGWRWILVGLVATACTLLALPLHRAAVAELLARRLLPAGLASVTVVACAAGAVVAVTQDRTTTPALTAVAVSTLTVTALWLRGGVSFLDAPAWYGPAALGAALTAGLAWGLVQDVGAGRDAALAVLVGAAPAAQLVAGPLALVAARRRGTGAGYTLPDQQAVLATPLVDTIALDLAGTVTTGDLTVVSVDPVEPDHDRNLRWFAGALEHASEHRIGRAIAGLSARGRLSNVEQQPGTGISGSVDRHPVRVGAPDWLGIAAEPGLWTTVGVEVDARVLGTITVAEHVRPDAAEGVAALRALGLDVVLLSPERPDRTAEVARQSGISTVHAGLDDAGRDAVLESLAADGRRLAVAGLPSQRALVDVEDLGVRDHAVTRVAAALTASRQAVATGRRARRLALLLGGIGIGLGASGAVPPWAAAIVATITTVVAGAVGARRPA
ncbi:MAG: HAD family hydrolase [Aeromicrobium erythreum]